MLPMKLSAKDQRSIKFVTEFLRTVIHVPITPDSIIAAAENKPGQSAIWGVLVDLSLIYTSSFPNEPKEKLNKFWHVLSEEGQEHVPVEGKQLVKDILEELQFPGSIDIVASSPSDVLEACAWLMASTRLLETYLFRQPTGITVHPPLPYGILSQCHSEATRTTPPTSGCQTSMSKNEWAAVEHTAHSARRLHGKCEILQKQLQHECVRHATLEQQMHGIMSSINVQATPYEGIVAEDPALLRKHLDSLSALGAHVRTRQAAVELVPHFLQWASNSAKRSRRLNSPSVPSLSQEDIHHLMMPRRILQYDAAELEQVLSEQQHASIAALTAAQQAILSGQSQQQAQVGCRTEDTRSCSGQVHVSEQAVRRCIMQEIAKVASPGSGGSTTETRQPQISPPIPQCGNVHVDATAGSRTGFTVHTRAQHCKDGMIHACDDIEALCSMSIGLAKLAASERATVRASIGSTLQALEKISVCGL